MSEIAKGDLVVVVRWTHPCPSVIAGMRLGSIFPVESLGAGPTHCYKCGTDIPGPTGRNGLYSLPLAWLRRIDPLVEPETIEHKEETPA